MNEIDKLKAKLTDQTIIFEATVPTGLETTAVDEIVQKGLTSKDNVVALAGRIYFLIPVISCKETRKLRSVDNINILVDTVLGLAFGGNKEEDLAKVVGLLDVIDILSSVKHWAYFSEFEGIIEPTKQQHDEARIIQNQLFQGLDNDEVLVHNVLKYRVTCDRIGCHYFSSNNAATHFGGNVQDRYNWVVALSDWDLNILLRIDNDNAMVCLKGTVKSLHRRDLIVFGATTLRPTISYGMLALAKLQPGDHLIDPLCGSGSIPIECMYSFPTTIVSCGDIDPRAVYRTSLNLEAQFVNCITPEVFEWNAANLPYNAHSVDAIVSDLPFGKRSGSKRKNVKLYKDIIAEFARVLKPKTGRIVLLTKDGSNLFSALDYKKPYTYWNITYITSVNVGALKCIIVVAVPRRKT